MYMVLPSIWRICFTALQSYRVGNQLYASVDLEQRWFEDGHFYLCTCAALPALIIYAILLPIYVFLKMKKIDRNDPQTKFKYGFLYIGYRRERWWWEIM